jgi:BON domain
MRSVQEEGMGTRENHWRTYRSSDEEFDRRGGWRMGSDYYGNNPERYASGTDMDFEVRGHVIRGHRDRQSFNDRWQDSYRGSDSSETGPFRGRGPRGYRRSDESIREDACELLTEDDRIDASNIDVTVSDCEITLSGGVSSREEKRRAEDLVGYLPGVRDVHNRLRVLNEGGRIESG